MDTARHSDSPGPILQSPSETRTTSSSSSMVNAHDTINLGLYLPRPTYSRPSSYGQPSPSNCAHCGNLTPRYGTTTVYGTPLKQTPATSTEKFSRFSDRYSTVSSKLVRRTHALFSRLIRSMLMVCRPRAPSAENRRSTPTPLLSQYVLSSVYMALMISTISHFGNAASTNARRFSR